MAPFGSMMKQLLTDMDFSSGSGGKTKATSSLPNLICSMGRPFCGSAMMNCSTRSARRHDEPSLSLEKLMQMCQVL